jgi:hypothetical protein
LLRLAALAWCVLLLSGCSLVRFGYGQLDHIAAWMADDYFDLDGQQKDEFAKRFDRFYAWHRYEQLPDYAAFLAETRGKLEKGLAREDVLWFVDGLRARYRAIVVRGSDDAAALLLTITPGQLDALQRQWDRDNRRFGREYKLGGSAEDIRRARVRRTLEQVEDWVGRLDHEQENRITAMVNALPMTEQLRHEDRLRRQREFLALMAKRGNRGEFSVRLRQWLINWEEGRSPEFVRNYNAWFDQRVQIVVEIDRMLTPQQRAHALRRLQHYVDDFTKLAERPRQRAVAQ